MTIPRLSLLEIERKGNDSKKDSTKRKILFSSYELSFLKNRGAELLPPLDLGILEGFSRLSGSKMTDSIIREEIRRYQETRIDNQPGFRTELPIFITGDFMMENYLLDHDVRIQELSTEALLEQVSLSWTSRLALPRISERYVDIGWRISTSWISSHPFAEVMLLDISCNLFRISSPSFPS